ncbi:MAG: hypothetical protein FRX49_05863 [Trebouxia sp. A1-2]|nr:MAG: hypothetical protein FRX49_05863 [Trebouxia sp. A1-2]
MIGRKVCQLLQLLLREARANFGDGLVFLCLLIVDGQQEGTKHPHPLTPALALGVDRITPDGTDSTEAGQQQYQTGVTQAEQQVQQGQLFRYLSSGIEELSRLLLDGRVEGLAPFSQWAVHQDLPIEVNSMSWNLSSTSDTPVVGLASIGFTGTPTTKATRCLSSCTTPVTYNNADTAGHASAASSAS